MPLLRVEDSAQMSAILPAPTQGLQPVRKCWPREAIGGGGEDGMEYGEADCGPGAGTGLVGIGQIIT